MKKRILVLGGTGLFGTPTVDQLLKDGFQVRVLARDPEQAKAVLPDAVEVVPGDVTDLASLESALADCWGVHISVGGPVDLLSAENAASLAPKLGLQLIGYISGSTVAEENRWFPMVAQKLDAEKALRECGVAYTIFCPTWPMEQIARFARDGKPFLMGKQPLPVHFFAAVDLARMVSAAFQSEDAAGKRFYVYGPDALSMPEALARYCRVLHPEVEKISDMPIWLARVIARLTRNQAMKFAADLMGYFDKTQEVGDSAEADRILGAPEITLDEWINSRK
jgi:NADH dehydrogenase